jgi:hypothetical protein
VPILIAPDDTLGLLFKTSFLLHQKWLEIVRSATLNGLWYRRRFPFKGLTINEFNQTRLTNLLTKERFRHGLARPKEVLTSTLNLNHRTKPKYDGDDCSRMQIM